MTRDEARAVARARGDWYVTWRNGRREGRYGPSSRKDAEDAAEAMARRYPGVLLLQVAQDWDEEALA